MRAFWNSIWRTGTLEDRDVVSLIRHRKVFPCYFGSALKLEGVDELLEGLERYAAPPLYPQEFGARVFKITRDPQGGPPDLSEGHRRVFKSEGSAHQPTP